MPNAPNQKRAGIPALIVTLCSRLLNLVVGRPLDQHAYACYASTAEPRQSVVQPSFPRSRAEEMMIQILSLSKDPISLTQIAREIELSDPTILSGKTPRSSLYSIVHRREKRRDLAGLSRLFSQQIIHREVYFALQSQHN